MPPEKAKRQPTAEAREAVIAWIGAVRKREAKRNAGDPGPVPARRLSNAEYDYTIRDLTGVDIRPTREFPVDPANEAGFDNSAESLAMSPALLKKYLEAARRVADHLVLKPDGLAFAPHPVVADTDRDKYCVRRIIDFYQRQRTDYADYFLAAWRFQHRAALGKPDATLADVAAEAGLSREVPGDDLGRARPSRRRRSARSPRCRRCGASCRRPTAIGPDAARAGCERMRDFVVELRQQLVPEVKNLTAPRDQQRVAAASCSGRTASTSANRMRYAGGALADPGRTSWRLDGAAARALAVPDGPGRRSSGTRRPSTGSARSSPTPSSSRSGPASTSTRRRRRSNAGRLLSAGFHSMTGYFRDDGPLCELILDEHGQRELDRLWREFDFVTGAPMRQYTSFIWFERTDSPLHARPGVRLRPRRGQGRHVRGEDRAGWPRSTWRRRAGAGPSEDALGGDRGPLRDHRGEHPPGRAGPAGGGAEPRRGAAGVRRAGLSPAADDGGARRTSPPSTGRCASRTG